jgi:hypothetical protein
MKESGLYRKINLNRDWFKTNSEGENEFDYVLEHEIGIEGNTSDIDEIDIIIESYETL